MIKAAAALLAALVLGGSVAGAAAWLLTAFHSPNCGEDCQAPGITILWILTALPVFGVATWRMMRRWPAQPWRWGAGWLGLALLMLAWPLTDYQITLHRTLHQTRLLVPPQPDVDFSHMSIATRPIPAYDVPPADRGTWAKTNIQIPRWDRCLIGTTTCDAPLRYTEMQCARAGFVFVTEQNWSALALIPEENLTGIEPLQNTRFCQNHTDNR